MKNLALALIAATAFVATPALAQPIVLTDTAGTGPVIIRGSRVISDVKPIDMNLTPVPGSRYAYTNDAGQIVIQASRFNSINVTKN
ncbi:hypothetical protein [Jannaschia sp. 2305UL9-9]|uniref:hypothetical protein n=1 Tax=Jannaschia sp. 2305UL9-9 TaxID=3121638 RepID=UPI003526C4A2